MIAEEQSGDSDGNSEEYPSINCIFKDNIYKLAMQIIASMWVFIRNLMIIM